MMYTETIDQPLYDTQVHPQIGVRELRFFCVPRGEGFIGLETTNLEISNALPQHVGFEIKKISVITSALKDDKRQIFWNGSLEFVLMSKTYLALPLSKFADSEQYLLGPTIRISAMCNFCVFLRWNPPPLLRDPCRILVMLGGERTRSVA